MALDAKQLTDLSKETNKARHHLDAILDFVDLINKDAENLDGDVTPAGDKIKDLSGELGQSINEIKTIVETQLNKMSIDPEQMKDAAQKLILYHESLHQVIAWAETQKSNHAENSYWWRYWVGVLENVMQIAAEKGDLEKA